MGFWLWIITIKPRTKCLNLITYVLCIRLALSNLTLTWACEPHCPETRHAASELSKLQHPSLHMWLPWPFPTSHPCCADLASPAVPHPSLHGGSTARRPLCVLWPSWGVSPSFLAWGSLCPQDICSENQGLPESYSIPVDKDHSAWLDTLVQSPHAEPSRDPPESVETLASGQRGGDPAGRWVSSWCFLVSSGSCLWWTFLRCLCPPGTVLLSSRDKDCFLCICSCLCWAVVLYSRVASCSPSGFSTGGPEAGAMATSQLLPVPLSPSLWPNRGRSSWEPTLHTFSSCEFKPLGTHLWVQQHKASPSKTHGSQSPLQESGAVIIPDCTRHSHKSRRASHSLGRGDGESVLKKKKKNKKQKTALRLIWPHGSPVSVVTALHPYHSNLNVFH